MEHSPQPQIQEQAKDHEAGEKVEAEESLAQTASGALKESLITTSQVISDLALNGGKSKADAASALATLKALALELTGLTIEQMEAERCLSEDKILDEFERLIGYLGITSSIAEGLVCLDSERAWDLRKRLREEYFVNDFTILSGLGGINSPAAWELRNRALQVGGQDRAIVLSLSGLDAQTSWNWREMMLERGGQGFTLGESLAGLDSEDAWRMRKELLEKGEDTAVCRGLAGVDSPRAWEMRDRLLEERAFYSDIALSLAGLDTPRAWEMRERLLKLEVKSDISISLVGIDTKRAWDFREVLKEKGASVASMSHGIAGIDSARAAAIRDDLVNNIDKEIMNASYAARSLSGDHLTGIAWRAAKGLLPHQQGEK